MKRNAFSIPLPPSFSFGECLWFLNRNYDDCMHHIEDDRLFKAVSIAEDTFLLEMAATAETLDVTILQGRNDAVAKQMITTFINDWFDLDKEVTPFYKFLKKDKRVAYMATAFQGLRLISIPDMFEAICWSIIGQQINLAFAYKLKRRLVERYGTSILHEGKTYHLFPAPEMLVLADSDELRSMQFSAAKIKYLTGVANAFAGGSISKEQLKALPDLQSRQQRLIAMNGIGIWTANYTLMKSLKEPGCIPYGDAGLLNALIAHDIIADKKDTATQERFFNQFAGWESYLVFYLWRSLAKK